MAFRSLDIKQPLPEFDAGSPASQTTDSAALAALVGSRLCHDLISPVGAIQNGIELIGLSPSVDPAGDEMRLMTHSVENASAKLKFFRIAFGLSCDQSQVSRQSVQAIFDGFTRGTRKQVELAGTETMTRTQAQLVMLAFLCLESILPMGGRIAVIIEPRGAELTVLNGQLDAEHPLWQAFEGPVDLKTLQPTHVQFALLPLLAAKENRRPQLHDDAGVISLTV